MNILDFLRNISSHYRLWHYFTWLFVHQSNQAKFGSPKMHDRNRAKLLIGPWYEILVRMGHRWLDQIDLLSLTNYYGAEQLLKLNRCSESEVAFRILCAHVTSRHAIAKERHLPNIILSRYLRCNDCTLGSMLIVYLRIHTRIHKVNNHKRHKTQFVQLGLLANNSWGIFV